MARPVTLFTGQWADLTLEVICQKASKWGYDGIELPCWGDHFNVQKALKDDGYCQATYSSPSAPPWFLVRGNCILLL